MGINILVEKHIRNPLFQKVSRVVYGGDNGRKVNVSKNRATIKNEYLPKRNKN